jgi:putative peptide zinc metalloprotease protein
MSAGTDNPTLPPLRPDLEFYPGPPEPDGSPTYSLHDPLTGQYHKIGWAEATILQHLHRPVRLEALMNYLRRRTTLEATEEDVLRLSQQAAASGLTVTSGFREVPQLLAEAARKRLHPLMWLATHYLFFRVPLIYPARFLQRTVPAVRLLASRSMLILYLLLSALGLLFVLQQPAVYFGTFLYFFDWRGAALYAVTVVALKLIHEFAHAYVATALGVRVRSMGIAFMVFWPIPFCDVTDAWRLRDRRLRARIGLAGIMVESVIAGVCLFLWGLTDEGAAQSIFFLLSSASLASTLMVNLNPAMRFDGYYVVSDLWGIDNLQPRAFAMTKWFLRKALLGLDDPPPESGVGRRRLAGFVAYSLYTWVYRVGLYIGIALIVYYKFYKALGIILFSLEIAMFLVAPVVREAKVLWAARERLRLNPRLLLTLTLLAALLLWLALPLPRRVALPAVAIPVQSQVLYAPSSGRIAEMRIERDQTVAAGERLMTIVSEERRTRLALLAIEKAILEDELERLRGSGAERSRLPQKREELLRVNAQLAELRQRERRNTLHAALDGVVIDWDPGLREGRYVTAQKTLGRIAPRARLRVVAFVPEDYFEEVRPAMAARFVPRDEPRPLPATVRLVHPVRAKRLPYASLASTTGGEIPVSGQDAGRLEPVDSYYRIEADLGPAAALPRLGQSGALWIRTGPRSRLADLFRRVLRVLQRESSF